MTNSTVLGAQSVSKAFGGIQALSDVSVEFRAGEVHGLIGPNGSGKSTLLSIISGALTPDDGRLQVMGTSLHAIASPRQAGRLGIHRMPQELALVPSMTVFDNITLGRERSRRHIAAGRETRRRAVEMLTKVGLGTDLELPAGALRPSHQRLLMLARTMYRAADVIIADEPTAGLLPDDAAHVTAALATAAEHGACVIYVSHYLSEIARIAHRVTVLRDGRVVTRFDRPADRDELLTALLDGAPAPRIPTDLPAPTEPLLTVRGLSAGALDQLDLTVRRHEIVGIAGLFGSGREDVLPAIVGDLPRRTGAVESGTGRVHDPRSALRHKVGYLNGDRTRAVIPAMSVAAHASLPVIARLARVGWIRRDAERTAVADALGRVSVKGVPEQPLRTLSGGNQQRALLARWLLAGVDVLLVDEPAVGVDVRARRQMLDELREFARHGAVVVASSDNDDLLEICDRIVCLRDGRRTQEIAGTDIHSAAVADAIT